MKHRNDNCSSMSMTAACQHAAFAMSLLLCLMGAISVVSIILFILVLSVIVFRVISLQLNSP